jgi:hypothetical protein
VDGLTTYGATHTLTGTQLLGSNDGGMLLLEPGPYSYTAGSWPGILEWTPQQIRFRFPYPNSGQVWVKTDQGEALAGSLYTRWLIRPLPRSEDRLFSSHSHVDTALVEDEALGAAFLANGKLGVAVWKAEGVETWQLPVGSRDGGLGPVRLMPEPGRPFGALALGPTDGGTALWQVRWQDQTPSLVEVAPVAVTSPLYVTEAADGGRAAWVATPDGDLSRLREGPTGWAVDRGPVDRPDNEALRHAWLASVGDTLFLSGILGTRSCTLGFCSTSYSGYVWRLDPQAQAFTQERSLGRISESGMARPARIWASRYGRLLLDDGSTPLLRSPDGTWRYVSARSNSSSDLYAEFPHGLVRLSAEGPSGEDRTLLLRAAGVGQRELDAEGAFQQSLLWPAPTVLGFKLSASGRPLMLTSVGSQLESPLHTCQGAEDCEAGQSCVNGACACTPTSCAQGCCAGIYCLSPSATACGTAGSVCRSCVEVGATSCTPAGTCQ